LYTAIGRLVLKLGRRLRKRKTRLGRMLVRQNHVTMSASAAGQTTVHEAGPVPQPSSSRFRNKEGGQEMRVFPFRRRGAHQPNFELV
jgi:hypothetical protein